MSYRIPSAIRSGVLALSLVTIGAAIGAAAVVHTAAPVMQAPSYAVVTVDADGGEWVLDHGLSATDCARQVDAWRRGWGEDAFIICEPSAVG